jgi:hypothetical protein
MLDNCTTILQNLRHNKTLRMLIDHYFTIIPTVNGLCHNAKLRVTQEADMIHFSNRQGLPF